MPDPLLELPAVGARLAALDALELRTSFVELCLRTLVVDLFCRDRIVDERDRAVLEHLKEAGAGRELADVVRVPVEIDPRRTGIQRRDQRRVAREDTDLARLSGDDDQFRLALECGAVGRDERDVERAKQMSGSAS